MRFAQLSEGLQQRGYFPMMGDIFPHWGFDETTYLAPRPRGDEVIQIRHYFNPVFSKKREVNRAEITVCFHPGKRSDLRVIYDFLKDRNNYPFEGCTCCPDGSISLWFQVEIKKGFCDPVEAFLELMDHREGIVMGLVQREKEAHNNRRSA